SFAGRAARYRPLAERRAREYNRPMPPVNGPFEYQVTGEPLQLGERTVTPVGRLVGRGLSMDAARAGGGAWAVRLEAVAVTIREPGGEVITLTPRRQPSLALGLMAGAAVLTVVTCRAIMRAAAAERRAAD